MATSDGKHFSRVQDVLREVVSKHHKADLTTAEDIYSVLQGLASAAILGCIYGTAFAVQTPDGAKTHPLTNFDGASLEDIRCISSDIGIVHRAAASTNSSAIDSTGIAALRECMAISGHIAQKLVAKFKKEAQSSAVAGRDESSPYFLELSSTVLQSHIASVKALDANNSLSVFDALADLSNALPTSGSMSKATIIEKAVSGKAGLKILKSSAELCGVVAGMGLEKFLVAAMESGFEALGGEIFAIKNLPANLV